MLYTILIGLAAGVVAKFLTPGKDPGGWIITILLGIAGSYVGTFLGKSLGHDTRERIHIMTAEVNGCNYCLSAHTYVGGKFNRLSKEDMELNREGHSTDPKADAAVQFAYKVAKSRGHVTDADFAAVRAAGFTDEQIIDIVAETAFSFTTNLFNNTFKTDIDTTFPPLQTRYDEKSAA